MKKAENYINSLRVLHKADYEKAVNDEIYRMGVIGQFNLTFEMAWKTLQELLREEGVVEADSGSPRDILKLAYKCGFVQEQEQWLLMLKKRNINIHIYDEEEVDELLVLIRDSFVPAFDKMEEIIKGRMESL